MAEKCTSSTPGELGIGLIAQALASANSMIDSGSALGCTASARIIKRQKTGFPQVLEIIGKELCHGNWRKCSLYIFAKRHGKVQCKGKSHGIQWRIQKLVKPLKPVKGGGVQSLGTSEKVFLKS